MAAVEAENCGNRGPGAAVLLLLVVSAVGGGGGSEGGGDGAQVAMAVTVTADGEGPLPPLSCVAAGLGESIASAGAQRRQAARGEMGDAATMALSGRVVTSWCRRPTIV